MRFPAACLLILPLFLAACGDGATEGNQAVEKVVPTAVSRVPFAHELEEPGALRKAFDLAFAKPAVTIKGETYTFQPAALFRIKDRLVLLSEGSGPDCHACSGFLAVHYIAETDDGMKITQGWTDAIPGSEFGAPPKWTMRTDLMSAPVIQTEGSGMGQGIECSTARLTELLPEGPKARTANVPLNYSDSGAIVDATPPSEVLGSIGPAERDRDFVVHYKGSVTRDVIWTRQGEAFVAGKDAQTVPQC